MFTIFSDMICEPTHFSKINNEAGIKGHLGLNCTSHTQESDIWPPAIDAHGKCVFQVI